MFRQSLTQPARVFLMGHLSSNKRAKGKTRIAGEDASALAKRIGVTSPRLMEACHEDSASRAGDASGSPQAGS